MDTQGEHGADFNNAYKEVAIDSVTDGQTGQEDCPLNMNGDYSNTGAMTMDNMTTDNLTMEMNTDQMNTHQESNL